MLFIRGVFLNHQLEASIRLQVWPLCSNTERNTANRENKPTWSPRSGDKSRGADKRRKDHASPTLTSAAGKNHRATQHSWVRLQLTSPLSIIQVSQPVKSGVTSANERAPRQGWKNTQAHYWPLYSTTSLWLLVLSTSPSPHLNLHCLFSLFLSLHSSSPCQNK